jgi:hypothetical protein
MIEYELNVPNLDCMEDEELMAMRNVFLLMANYCSHKADAHLMRLDGNIPAALSSEALADRIYHILPPWARW